MLQSETLDRYIYLHSQDEEQMTVADFAKKYKPIYVAIAEFPWNDDELQKALDDSWSQELYSHEVYIDLDKIDTEACAFYTKAFEIGERYTQYIQEQECGHPGVMYILFYILDEERHWYEDGDYSARDITPIIRKFKIEFDVSQPENENEYNYEYGKIIGLTQLPHVSKGYWA